MKLYHNPLSPNARRVLLTAAYLGLRLDEQVIDVAKGEHKSPDYLALNPNGMIPTLVDGPLTLWESRAIIQYLAAQRPASGLLGRNEADRAEITRWLTWDAAHLSPPVGTLIFETLFKPMLGLGAADPDAIHRATGEVRRFFAVLDASLIGKSYLVGKGLTIADLGTAATLTYAGPLQLPVAGFANLAPWFERVASLDAWQKTQPAI
jgi:glutathione S-transferase